MTCIISAYSTSHANWRDARQGKIRLASIDRVEQHVRQFIHRIIQHSLDTDRRLRGMGYPENVTHFDATKQMSRAEAEIVRLAQAHRALLEEKNHKERQQRAAFLPWKRLEEFYANNKGLIWLCGILIATLGALWRFLVGG